MAAPRKYPDELRERATRLAVDARRDPATRTGALGGSASSWASTPRRCATGSPRPRSTKATGRAPRPMTRTRLAELERENRELRRANAILKSASAFFAAELDRPQR